MHIIAVIFLIFSIVFIFVWIWFFKNETNFCEKLYERGIEAFKEEKYKRAKKFFTEIILMIPTYKDARYKLGLAHLMLGEYEGAKHCFEIVLKEAPKNSDAMFSLGEAYLFLENIEKAEEHYTNALKEKPESFEYNIGMGLLKIKQKDFEKALEYLNKADNIKPGNIKVKFYINKCLDELCDYEEEEKVEQIIERYLEIENKKDFPKELYITIAKAYAKLGKIEEAEEYCKKALRTNAEDVESYKFLAITNLLKRNFSSAKNFLVTALHLQPKNSELHNLLSYVLCYQVDNCPIKRCREKYHEMVSKMLK